MFRTMYIMRVHLMRPRKLKRAARTSKVRNNLTRVTYTGGLK